MSKVIHFRVLIDHQQDVFRDIEVRSDDTLLDFHNIIQEAFGFDNAQMASFYLSNEDWEKGQEITIMEVKEPNEKGEPIWLMNDVNLNKIVFESGQKLLYVSDFLLMWCFYIDVVSIKELKDTVILPRIVSSYGDAPEQYSKSPDVNFDGTALSLDEDEDKASQNEFDEMFRTMSDEEGTF